MIVSIFNKKGGVAKTSLAFNLAKDLDFFLISNDDSVIEKIYPNRAKILQKLQVFSDSKRSIIYDLGGFIDPALPTLFRNSDLIIVPTNLDSNSIKRTVNTINELEEYCQNIIIVITRINNRARSKYQKDINMLKKLGYEIFEIRESEAFPNSMKIGETIIEQSLKSSFKKHIFRHIYEEYINLLDRIRKEETNNG